MRFSSRTSLDGVTEQLFALDGIPGVLWTPEAARGTRPLIVLGHGGGQHKKAPGVVARARLFAAGGGFAVVSADVPNHGERPKFDELDRIARRGIVRRARAAARTMTAAATAAVEVRPADWRCSATLSGVTSPSRTGGG
jgi:pimeloyl-ACP methyl ester carboxylesterase